MKRGKAELVDILLGYRDVHSRPQQIERWEQQYGFDIALTNESWPAN
jgi:hypothetical protein